MLATENSKRNWVKEERKMKTRKRKKMKKRMEEKKGRLGIRRRDLKALLGARQE